MGMGVWACGAVTWRLKSKLIFVYVKAASSKSYILEIYPPRTGKMKKINNIFP